MRRLALAAALIALSSVAYAQSGERASTPPGTGQDGAKPADGALKGGAILPGESGGVPQQPTQRDENRCRTLEGTMREQCLRDLDGAAAGGTRGPGVPPVPVGRDPAQDPPPQNPR